MPILSTDIKLLASQRLTDFDDGGGQMTGTVIEPNQVNNLFPDISELDEVYGRVNLRKAFPAVLTNDTDPYYGAHMIIDELPDNPNVSLTMFKATSFTDERQQARDRVESYLIQGPETRWFLYGDHLIGQGALRLWCRPEAPDPEVGEVYVVSNENTSGGAPLSPIVQQFARITKIQSRVTQTFEDTQGTYQRDVIIVEIGSTLRDAYPGISVTRVTPPAKKETLIRSTLIAAASRYYATRPLKEDIAMGALTLEIGSPYTPLVPSTSAETPVADQSASLTPALVMPGRADAIELVGYEVVAVNSTAYTPRYAGNALIPGSVVVTIDGNEFFDDTQGKLIADAVYEGTVEYDTGLVQIKRLSGSASPWVTVDAIPGGSIAAIAFSAEEKITPATRGFTYIKTFQPIPKKGTLQVSYRALNKWYTLKDDGKGSVQGPNGEGTGTLDYATGTLVVTLTYLPDTNTSLIYTWGGDVAYDYLSATDPDLKPAAIEGTLAKTGIVPGTVTFSWIQGGAGKTATVATDGTISGDATGRLIYGNGDFYLEPTNLPDYTTTFIIDYDWGATDDESFTPTVDGNGAVQFTVANAPIEPGTVQITIPIRYRENGSAKSARDLVAQDNGAGSIYCPELDVTLGTVNYATGAFDFSVVVTSSYWKTTYTYITSNKGGSWQSTGRAKVSVAYRYEAGDITVAYVQDSATPTTAQEILGTPPIKIDLNPRRTDTILPGSVRFTLNGRTYIDRNGALYYALDKATNAGTSGGTINYSTGIATITNWADGPATFTLHSCAVGTGALITDKVYFRTPGSPLRPASFSIRATREDTGEQLLYTADQSGNINGAYAQGFIDIESGVGWIQFGSLVADAGLTPEEKLEAWYDAGDVDGSGNIWRPIDVIASTVTYSCVILTVIPLDADLLGLDPVRLPSDGKVLTYQKGDVIVILNSQYTVVASPVGGATVDVGRTDQAYMLVRDANNDLVAETQYTVDLAAGTLTWAGTLDTVTYPTPWTIEDRIEDMLLVSDVDAGGTLSVNRSITRDYAKDVTLVASALLMGDKQARYYNKFEQNTWTGVWSDTLIGSEPSSSYNDITYPIEVTNDGAVQERWRCEFVSASAVNVIGEAYGQVLTAAPIASDIAPVNPATGQPFFTLKLEGWGGGWSTGNVLRFNTAGANEAVWFARTTLAGQQEYPVDQFRLQIRGDRDT